MTGYLDIAGAARFLGVSSRTVRRRLDRIPHYRCDFGIRFWPEDLAAYMAAFRKEPVRAPKVDLDTILGPRRKAASR